MPHLEHNDVTYVAVARAPIEEIEADVGLFFIIYAKIDGVWLAPAWLEGREVIAVFEDRAKSKPPDWELQHDCVGPLEFFLLDRDILRQSTLFIRLARSGHVFQWQLPVPFGKIVGIGYSFPLHGIKI